MMFLLVIKQMMLRLDLYTDEYDNFINIWPEICRWDNKPNSIHYSIITECDEHPQNCS